MSPRPAGSAVSDPPHASGTGRNVVQKREMMSALWADGEQSEGTHVQ